MSRAIWFNPPPLPLSGGFPRGLEKARSNYLFPCFQHFPMFSKSALLTLCFAFFLTSLTLLLSPSSLTTPRANPLTRAAAPAASAMTMPIAAHHIASRTAAQLVVHQSPTIWGLWGRALQRTRQLLWMLTRHDRLLRTSVELV